MPEQLGHQRHVSHASRGACADIHGHHLALAVGIPETLRHHLALAVGIPEQLGNHLALVVGVSK